MKRTSFKPRFQDYLPFNGATLFDSFSEIVVTVKGAGVELDKFLLAYIDENSERRMTTTSG